MEIADAQPMEVDPIQKGNRVLDAPFDKEIRKPQRVPCVLDQVKGQIKQSGVLCQIEPDALNDEPRRENLIETRKEPLELVLAHWVHLVCCINRVISQELELVGGLKMKLKVLPSKFDE